MVPGNRPRVIVMEVVCGPVRLEVGGHEVRTRKWMTGAQLRGLMLMVGPVIGEMVECVVGRGGIQPRLVVGCGLRAALVLRKRNLVLSGLVVEGQSVSLMEDKVVVSVGKVQEDQEGENEQSGMGMESQGHSKYFNIQTKVI